MPLMLTLMISSQMLILQGSEKLTIFQILRCGGQFPKNHLILVLIAQMLDLLSLLPLRRFPILLLEVIGKCPLFYIV
jgi:hypothetical protein